MVQTLEAIKSTEGSIKVGATGTVGSLMTRELESLKHTPNTPNASKRRSQTSVVSVPCGSSTTKILQPRRNLPNEASSSSTSSSSSGGHNTTNQSSLGNTQKPKPNIRKNVNSIPMLKPDGIPSPSERTPNREKPNKKMSNIVEVVDLKCGHPSKAWPSPIANKLKKLGFSKLSETIS